MRRRAVVISRNIFLHARHFVLYQIKIWNTCADARGIKNLPLIEGAEIITMAELAAWTMDSDKVINF